MTSPRSGFFTLVLAVFALYQWQARRSEREIRKLGVSRPKPHEVTTWEGEGGALKDSDAQR